MAEQPTYYDSATRKRIGDAVRGWEAGDDGRGPGRELRAGMGDIWLARATAFIPHGTLGSFVILKPDGDKGEEIDGAETVSAYVREGACLEDRWYHLIESCGADDAILEVVDPELVLLGAPTARVSAPSSATITIHDGLKGGETSISETVSALVRTGIVLSGEVYTIRWLTDGWELYNPQLQFIGKTDAQITKGSSGTISVYSGTLGSETDTGENVGSVHNRYATVATTKWVRCEWNHDSLGWEITSAEC